MKPTDLLKEDHRRVDRLFQNVKDTPKGEHPALFKQIKAELDVHAHIEETAFYPTLLKKGKKDLQDITREGIEEHGQAKMFLAELASMTSRNKQYEAKLKVLMEDIEHHVKEEEDDMFPMVEKQFTTAAQEKMTAAMEAERAKFIKKMTPDEQKALEQSMTAAASEKGTFGKIFDAAKDAVTNMLGQEPVKGNGKSKPGARSKAVTSTAKDADAPPKKTTAKAGKPAPREKVDTTLRRSHVSRAQK